MKSRVLFADMRSTGKENLFYTLDLLLEGTDIKSRFEKNNLIAIKLHFGERGTTGFVSPIFVRKIVDKVKHYEGKPFITDTTTLYRGERSEAVKIPWNETTTVFQKKMVEYASGVLKGKEGRAIYLNFLMNISSACDCYGHTDASSVPDIGIVSSTDPVAIDQASVDLVNKENGIKRSALKSHLKRGEDKFRGLYPEVVGKYS